jgi:hypothetical protein
MLNRRMPSINYEYASRSPSTHIARVAEIGIALNHNITMLRKVAAFGFVLPKPREVGSPHLDRQFPTLRIELFRCF